jgi:hypothetical protein
MAHPSHHAMKMAGHRSHASKLRRFAGGGDVAQDKTMIRKAFAEHDAQLHGGKKTKLKLRAGGHVEGKASKPRADRSGRKHAHRDMGGTTQMPQAPQAPMGAGAQPQQMITPQAAQIAKLRAMGVTPPQGGMPPQGAMPAQGAPMQQQRRGGRTAENRAKGGATGMKKKGAGNHVNVIVAGGGGQPRPQMPMPVPAAGAPMGARPPMPPMPPPGPVAAGMGGAGAPGPMMPPRPGMGAMPIRAKGGRVSYPLHDGAGGGEGRLQKIKAYGGNTMKEGQSASDGDREDRPAVDQPEKMRAAGGSR